MNVSKLLLGCVPVALVAVGLLIMPADCARGEEEADRKAEAQEAGGDAPGLPAARQARLQADLAWLADPARKGRHTVASRAAVAAYLARAFKAAGLRHVPGRSTWFQGPAATEGTSVPRNVLGWIPGTAAGSDAEAAGEYVVVSASYDGASHGLAGRTNLTNANDNATGTAALLEVARILVEAKRSGLELQRSILVAAFDLGKQGARGSSAFLEAEVLPVGDCVAMLSLEMLGRSLGDLVPNLTLVMGTEHSELLRKLASSMPVAEGRRVEPMSTFFHVKNAADYTPFQTREIPYAYITGGASRDYRQPSDNLARVRLDLLADRTDWVARFVVAIGNASKRPAWIDAEQIEMDIREVELFREFLGKVRRSMDLSRFPAMARTVLDNVLKNLDRMIERGKVTDAEQRALRSMLFALLPLAGLAAPRGGK